MMTYNPPVHEAADAIHCSLRMTPPHLWPVLSITNTCNKKEAWCLLSTQYPKIYPIRKGGGGGGRGREGSYI